MRRKVAKKKIRAPAGLQTLHVTVDFFRFDEFFWQLLAGLRMCSDLGYLRFEFGEGYKSEDGTVDSTMAEATLAVLNLPEMWFCELAHALPQSVIMVASARGWTVDLETEAEDVHQSRKTRLVRGKARRYDPSHLQLLRLNQDARLPIFNLAMHPDQNKYAPL